MRYFRKHNKKHAARALGRALTSLLLVFSLLASTTAEASFVVIGNTSTQLKKLTKNELSNLYLGKPVSLHTHQPVQPYNQPDNSLAYQQFYQTILGWTPSQVSGYWTQLVFSGELNPPPTVNNDAAAIAMVEQSPNAIAYVDSSSLAHDWRRVKVLYGKYTPPPIPYHPKRLYHSSQRRGYMTALTKNTRGYASAPANESTSSSSAPDPDTSLAKQLTAINENAQAGQNLWPSISHSMQMSGQENNVAVRHWILWFEQHRSVLDTMIDNATPYLYYIYQQIQRRHMPAEFTLLPMIESGFNPHAHSYAGASGLWQLMPAVAYDRGLPINWWYDSRRDILSSTNAALNFLQQLHAGLGSWYLAAAAYNEGPAALRAAIRHNKRAGKPTDYWALPMPNQTKQYVPKLLALTAIISNPAKYGVTLPYVPDRPFFGSVTTTSQIDLSEMSALSGVSIPIIKELNPGLKHFATAANTKRFTWLLPVTTVNTFSANLEKVIGRAHGGWQYHKIQAGETLGSIAKTYRTSRSLLKKVNYLPRTLLSTGKGILVPTHASRIYTPLASSSGNLAAPESASTQQLLFKALQKAAESQKKTLPKEVTGGSPISSSDSLKTLLGKLYNSD